MEEKFEILPHPDAFNVNKRYYTKKSLEDAIESYKELISEDNAFVIMGLPSDEDYFSVDGRNIVGNIINIELIGNAYVATIKFTRPTKEVATILENKKSLVVGLNQTANVNENCEVTDIKIISASLLFDPRLQLDPFDDLSYFVEQFKNRPFDHRYRNQLVTIIDAIYSQAKAKREIENDKEKE